MDVWCFTVVRVDDLEVFDGGLRDPPMEVEDEWLGLFIPAGRFVHQGDQFVGVFVCVAGQQCLQLLQQVVKKAPIYQTINRTQPTWSWLTKKYVKKVEDVWHVRSLGKWRLFHRSPTYPGWLLSSFWGPSVPTHWVPATQKQNSLRVTGIFFDTFELFWKSFWPHVTNSRQLLPQWFTLFDKWLLVRVFTSIINCELCAQNVGPDKRQQNQTVNAITVV